VIYYLFAFALAASYNVVMTKYVKAVANHAALQGAAWAGAVSLISAVQVLIYTHVPGAIVPQVLGACVGAFCGIIHCRRVSHV
jgi:hypothetical protein